ncbi:SIALI-17 repeat-containing surface protein [Streptococcus mitis]|uniref:SIALI-17 repeat-containing surface protein n=2 Tax=Streptococcus mitis TaxID=28037 RepID=UPI001156779A|nr:SIALI-17 repeat-containing surface protein [Streptococcus mitis]
MFFNRKGINQKNWRMIKKGKHFLFGCTLFLATGAVTIQNPHLVHADEMVASLNDSTKVKDEDPNSDKIPNDVENHSQVENPVKESDKISEHVPEEKILEKSLEHPVKAVDKTALNELIEKIRNTDLQTKTAKSVENLNLSLSRAQAVLDKEGASQDEIDKEVQALSESFAQLEEKSNDIDKKEKQADKANDSDEKKNPSTEKIAKVQALVSEINQLAGEISYEFSESESKSLQVFADLSEGKATESEVDGALNEAKSLRNKVANRVTRAQSGKRDPRNGKPIDGKGESGFRAIWISSIANKYEGSNALVNENKKELTFYNSDTLFSVMTAYGKRGNGEPLVRYPNGPKRGEEDPTPYYVKRVGVISGLNQVKGLKLRVAYKNFQTGKKEEVDIAANYWNVNNPEVQMALVGTIGDGGNVTPGTYHITIGANGTHKQNTITYTLTIKPQSERNTVRDLTPTYVDDVRHLTETEKNALIEKFKAEHPNVVNRANHIDFDHAEVSADGATMTIHFKDGFNPKTIQTNATNDVEAKHSSLTAYFGDSKELYTNPRELVRSKTGHEVPTTAQVTYKTPFNLQEAGTRNVVVTTTYENGVTKDVTTPYTVLDFLGKQDKKINQNQSGQLGDARNYVTVSDNSAVPGELTVRWKGGSSNVDTSAAGVQHKEIEILRGSHLMKTVNVPVEIVDNIKPTITAPDNITLTRLEGLPSEINIHAQDNDKGVGLKESNSVTVDNLPNPLSYNAKKSKIEINGVIPNNFQLGKSSIQVTVKAVDKKENTATKNITFHIQSQTQKYTAVANSQIQEVSYGEAPDAGTSIQKNGLPTGTRYGWATQPNTATGPGDQTEVVTVTYPDGSTDTVPVTVKVRKLSDEHIPTGKTITVNQNDPVTNDRLKAAVTVDNGGTRKVKSVTAAPISTVHAGSQTIKATVTYLDNTTDPVDIPLEVKDVTPPTIQTPAENTNWEVTALDKALPNMEVRAEDNENGSGIKNVTVTGLPDYLDYDSPTHTIKFKSGKDAVEKLSGNTPSQEFTLNIRAEDKAGNVSERTAKITVSSMSAKTNPTPIPQNTSYGQVPDSNASVDKAGLPDGTKVTWKTPPVVNTPGTTTGVAEVTYPDGSKDVVTVNVTVRKVSEDFTATGTQIEVNQNVSVTPEMLKGAVTATNAQGENGNSKIATVESKTPINTEAYGDQTIQAKVTYIDGSEQDVTIPLKVKDVTDPTIQTPANGQNIDLIALDKAFSPIKVTSEDNAGGSGVQSTTVTDLPDFLTYDDATKTIKFKADTQEVPKLPVGTDSQTHTATIRVTDNANNSSTSQLTFTVKSMTTKYDATANPQKQTVSYGETPDAGTSVNKTNLPEGTSYAWKTTPVTTDGPREKDGVVEVKYKDGSKDIVNVKVTVKGLSSEYEVTGTLIEVNQNDSVSNDDLKAKVTATSKAGNVNGTDKISTVTAPTISTANYGEQTINATVTFKDGTTKEVTIPLKVKDVTPPTIQSPAENTNWEMTALDKALPNMEVRAEDNENGSGIKNVTVTGLPDYLEYDSTTNAIKFKSGKQTVEKLAENTPSQEFTLNIRAEDKAGNVSERTAKITVSSMSTKNTPTPISQNTSYGQVPDPNKSVDKAGLPDGTKVTWKTPPVVNTPGATTGEVEITYPDGSKDVVTVNVTVRKVIEDFTANGTQIEVNQNVSVTPEMLKGAVTATNAQGENGNSKIATVESKTPINTEAYGDQTIQAKVTYIDGSEQDVTIPLKVKDVTDPTIQTPAEHTNWGMTALDKTLPPMKIEAKDNANGSGVATIEVNNMPSFLTFDQASGTIVFKEGVREVPRIDSDNVMYGVTIVARDKAGNSTSILVNITVWSMRGKYSPTAIAQEVDNGHVPNPETSVNKTGLPEGTTVTWKTRPDVSTPGSHPGVALVHYPDGTEDEVEVPVTVKKQSDTFNPTAKEPNQTVRHKEVPDPEKSINTNDLPAGTNYSWSEQPDTSKPGSKTGKVLITYPDKSTEEVTVTVNVTPQKDEYTPTGIPQEVDNGHVPDPETSVNKTGLPEGTTVTWKTRPDVSTPGSHPGVALVHYPDGTEDEVEVPVRVKEQKDTFNPTAKEPNQTVRHNEVPDPEKSINTNDLPKGTNYSWSEQPDTSKPGSKTGKVLITYPDKSTEEVTVTVNVTPQNDEYTPTGIPQEVDNGHVPDPETSVNKTGLPEGTTVTWKDTPVVNTPGSHPGVALVHYPDGTEDEVEVPVTVKKQSDTFNPTAKEPNQTVRHNEVPDPEKSINTNDLPAGTNYSWSEQPDTSKPGNKPGKVLITYPDNSTEEVTVTVEVTPQKDDYDPQPKAQTVDNGTVPNAEDSVDKTGLPSGTTVTWKTNPDVSTPGAHPTVALVTYPDGTADEVTVPITVKEQKDTFNPTAKQPNQTAKHGSEPSAEGSINTDGLPKGTSYTWVEKPDTNTTPGNKPGKVLITYPDKSTEEVTVTVEVTPQKDDYDPQPKTQTVEHAQVPSAKDSIENVKTLPEGTTFVWKGGKIPDTSKHGEKKGVVTVTYPDGSTEDVNVVITVNPEDFSPVVPMEKVPVKNPENLSPEEQDKVKEKVTKANPGKDVTVDSKGNVTITDPETKVSHEISREKLVFAYAKGEPETSENPEFNGGVNAPDSPIHEVPEFAGGVNGEPETQEILPEFNGGANTPNSPTHEVPEFNGGVNGELPDPVEVSKIQLMITKWIDENGKELKPADAKAPKVLGEANEAFEHGEIKGYVFVRTETKGDVVTHIFRKVSPVRSTGDGQQRPAAPSYDTNPRPDIATPAEVPATQPDGQPSQTVEVPAQLPNEVSETNPSVSQPQAVLPNTGTQEDRATGALGVLSLLGAFGLLFAKKKKDDEEEA